MPRSLFKLLVKGLALSAANVNYDYTRGVNFPLIENTTSLALASEIFTVTPDFVPPNVPPFIETVERMEQYEKEFNDLFEKMPIDEPHFAAWRSKVNQLIEKIPNEWTEDKDLFSIKTALLTLAKKHGLNNRDTLYVQIICYKALRFFNSKAEIEQSGCYLYPDVATLRKIDKHMLYNFFPTALEYTAERNGWTKINVGLKLFKFLSIYENPVFTYFKSRILESDHFRTPLMLGLIEEFNKRISVLAERLDFLKFIEHYGVPEVSATDNENQDVLIEEASPTLILSQKNAQVRSRDNAPKKEEVLRPRL